MIRVKKKLMQIIKKCFKIISKMTITFKITKNLLKNETKSSRIFNIIHLYCNAGFEELLKNFKIIFFVVLLILL